MVIKKAVITAAGKDQRKLPLQTLIDRDGVQRSVLEILVREALDAGIEEVCVVVHPGDEHTYPGVLGAEDRKVHFTVQEESLGYGHALYCARPFTGEDAFLHLVGDHLYISQGDTGCARHLVAVAAQEGCAISAVHPVRESIMPHYGVIGGQRMMGRGDLYTIDKVMEKPTPTEAELQLMIPGIRAGHYLCFFGMHVLTPLIMDILEESIRRLEPGQKANLSSSLNELARREQYLGLEKKDLRYDVGTKYGLLKAQIALALSGRDREQVLSELLELFASKASGHTGTAQS